MKILTNFPCRRIYLPCLILVIISFSSFRSVENKNFTNPQLVIEISNLDPFVYGNIVKEIRLHENLSIVTACVPIKLICIENNNAGNVTQEVLFNTIKAIINGVESVENIISTDLNVEDLEEDCLKARTQR